MASLWVGGIAECSPILSWLLSQKEESQQIKISKAIQEMVMERFPPAESSLQISYMQPERQLGSSSTLEMGNEDRCLCSCVPGPPFMQEHSQPFFELLEQVKQQNSYKCSETKKVSTNWFPVMLAYLSVPRRLKNDSARLSSEITRKRSVHCQSDCQYCK